MFGKYHRVTVWVQQSYNSLQQKILSCQNPEEMTVLTNVQIASVLGVLRRIDDLTIGSALTWLDTSLNQIASDSCKKIKHQTRVSFYTKYQVALIYLILEYSHRSLIEPNIKPSQSRSHRFNCVVIETFLICMLPEFHDPQQYTSEVSSLDMLDIFRANYKFSP